MNKFKEYMEKLKEKRDRELFLLEQSSLLGISNINTIKKVLKVFIALDSIEEKV